MEKFNMYIGIFFLHLAFLLQFRLLCEKINFKRKTFTGIRKHNTAKYLKYSMCTFPDNTYLKMGIFPPPLIKSRNTNTHI